METTTRHGPEHYAVLATAVLGLVVLALFRANVTPSPDGLGTHEQFGMPPCPMYLYLDVPCAGCGVTTAFTHAARGEFWRSAQTQPMGLLLAASLVVFALWALWLHLRGRNAYRDLRALPQRWFALALVLALLASWGYKLAITV